MSLLQQTGIKMSSENSEPKKEKDDAKLTWKDYIALAIALLQTNFLPIVLLITLLIVITILFAILL